MSTLEAMEKLDGLARGLARRRHMVAGHLSVGIGAGNPTYFYDIYYQHDGFDSSGFAKSGGGIRGYGNTLEAAVEMLLVNIEAEKKCS